MPNLLVDKNQPPEMSSYIQSLSLPDTKNQWYTYTNPQDYEEEVEPNYYQKTIILNYISEFNTQV